MCSILHFRYSQAEPKEGLKEMKGLIFGAILCVVLMLNGCASPDVFTNELQAYGEKVLVLNADMGERWVHHLQQEIRKAGFKVLVISTSGVKTETINQSESLSTSVNTAPYLLQVDGSDYDRCFGGGWFFSYYSIQLIDREKHQEIFSYHDTGHSEMCPPASGRIFRNSVNLLNATWEGPLTKERADAVLKMKLK